MKKLTQANLKLLKIHNQHNYADGRPYLAYFPEERGRGGEGASWRIIDPKRKYPGYYGAIGFSVFSPRLDKQRVFEDAVKHFQELYPCQSLARTSGACSLMPTPSTSWRRTRPPVRTATAPTAGTAGAPGANA